jgi:hypothetical protein
MAIAIILLGMLSGLVSVIGALLVGAPIWVALLIYPLAGVVSAAIVVAFAYASPRTEEIPASIAEA